MPIAAGPHIIAMQGAEAVALVLLGAMEAIVQAARRVPLAGPEERVLCTTSLA